MPQFSRSLNAHVAFAGNNARHDPVGYITTFQAPGGISLAPDIRAAWMEEAGRHPSSVDIRPTGGKVPVVGVMTMLLWDTGVTDSIFVQCMMSTANAARLGPMQDVSYPVRFGFCVSEYDPSAKKYYSSMQPGQPGPMGATIASLAVSDEVSREIGMNVVAVEFEAKPNATPKSLMLATAHGRTIVKKWGV
ncbi:hypothetical protein [Roseomonas sp. BN140053]|uniref:hypothetical protein n=1 Tax=Roseomonas sp. BN140053 TaxID=3391898 RepID=UPI0039EA1C3D